MEEIPGHRERCDRALKPDRGTFWSELREPWVIAQNGDGFPGTDILEQSIKMHRKGAGLTDLQTPPKRIATVAAES